MVILAFPNYSVKKSIDYQKIYNPKDVIELWDDASLIYRLDHRIDENSVFSVYTTSTEVTGPLGVRVNMAQNDLPELFNCQLGVNSLKGFTICLFQKRR